MADSTANIPGRGVPCSPVRYFDKTVHLQAEVQRCHSCPLWHEDAACRFPFLQDSNPPKKAQPPPPHITRTLSTPLPGVKGMIQRPVSATAPQQTATAGSPKKLAPVRVTSPPGTAIINTAANETPPPIGFPKQPANINTVSNGSPQGPPKGPPPLPATPPKGPTSVRNVPAGPRRENSVPVSRTVDALVSPRRENELETSADTPQTGNAALEPKRREARFARQVSSGELLGVQNQISSSAAGRPQTTGPIIPSVTRGQSPADKPQVPIAAPPRPDFKASGAISPVSRPQPQQRQRRPSNAMAVRPSEEYRGVLEIIIRAQAQDRTAEGKPNTGTKPDILQIDSENVDDDAEDPEPPEEFFSMDTIPVTFNEHRDRVANEIMTSEQSFNRFLRICIFIWQRPFFQKATRGEFGSNVSLETVSKLFGGLEAVYGASSILLQEFQNRLRRWSPTQLIGDVFLRFGDLLKLYAIYTKDHEQSIHLLQALGQIPAVAAYLEEKTKHPLSASKGLSYFLIMPVQRVPRYQLLIQDLLKNTPTDHPDYANLCAALEKIKQIATQVDQSVEERKKLDKLLSIEKSLSNLSGCEIIAPGRSFVKEGPLVKVCRKDKKKRMVWLFTDVLIYAAPSLIPGKYSFSDLIPLESLEVSELSDEDHKSASELRALGFKLQGPKKPLLVLAESPESKVEWLLALTTQINKMKERATSRIN